MTDLATARQDADAAEQLVGQIRELLQNPNERATRLVLMSPRLLDNAETTITKLTAHIRTLTAELEILRQVADELMNSRAHSNPVSAKTHLDTAVARAKDWYRWRAKEPTDG